MTHAPRSCTLVLAALACCACRREASEGQPAACLPHTPATLAGQVALVGELAGARRGCVTINAWGEGEAGREGVQPYLSRTYLIGDPDWIEGDGVLTRYFGLCDADGVGDRARSLPVELEIEACYDPDGLQNTSEGVVRASAHTHNGAKDVWIPVARKTETALPPGSPKKGG